MKKCPHFLRGRLRQCFAVALRERQRARLVQDSQAEERAWKLFGLVPVMLLHRPRGTGSVGKDELMSRADNFARGRWSELLNSARETHEFRSVNKEKNDPQELQRRGRAALGRVRQGSVVKGETGVHWRRFGTKDSGHSCTVARETATSQGQGDSSGSHGVRARSPS